MANLKDRRNKSIGPFKVWTDTGRRDPIDDSIVMVDINDPDNPGQLIKVPERELFLKEVYFKKNHVTDENSQKFMAKRKELAEPTNPEDAKPIQWAYYQLSTLLVSWDLEDTDDKGNTVPVPPTFEGMVKHQLDADLVYAIINRYYEVNRPPKALIEKSQNTSSQED